MEIFPQVVGFFAVATFLLSYQLKKRENIIAVNVLSRFLYILQYVLLGAFSGAVLDILGAVVSMIAGKKEHKWIRRHQTGVVIAITFSVAAIGLGMAFANQSILDLFSLAGILLHTSAFWMTNEKKIRAVSLLGSPFWIVYNFFSRAYGSAIGDILTILSILIAMFRYGKKEGSEN